MSAAGLTTALSLGVDALAYGMVLFVISIGLSVTMGLMRVVNLAHGALAMVGGVIAWWVTRRLGLAYGWGLLAAIAGTALLALPLERWLVRRVHGADALPQVLLTIGIAFAVIGLANLAVGPTLKTIPLPPALAAPVDIGFRSVSGHRLFVVAVGLGVALGLWWLFERTAFGLRLRAAVANAPMAEALGVRTDRLYAGAFALSAGLAGLGGVLGAEMLPIEPSYGLRYMVTFLVVVCVGGAGSVAGALAASLLLGAADTAGRYLFPAFGEFVFYAVVVAVVALFPRGLLGRTT